jgi:hypothetical protein
LAYAPPNRPIIARLNAGLAARDQALVGHGFLVHALRASAVMRRPRAALALITVQRPADRGRRLVRAKRASIDLFSENRCPHFGVMLWRCSIAAGFTGRNFCRRRMFV